MKFRLLIFALFIGMMVNAQNTSLTVITNPNSAPTELKLSELKSIFMGEKKTWPNGAKVKIALMKTTTEPGKLTCEKLYQKSGDEVQKFWLGYVFAGKGEAPGFFNTVNELQAFVAGNPGAIGIIDQTAPIAGVQVVMVDGKRSF